MSSFSLLFRAGVVAASMAALAACTMTPAYNDDTAAQKMALNFDAPTNPQEQIVYQDLSTRFGQSTVFPAMKRGRINRPSAPMSMSTRTASMPSNDEPLLRPGASMPSSISPRAPAVASRESCLKLSRQP